MVTLSANLSLALQTATAQREWICQAASPSRAIETLRGPILKQRVLISFTARADPLTFVLFER